MPIVTYPDGTQENIPSVDDPLPELVPMPVDVLDQNEMPLDLQGMYNDSGEVPLPGEVAADVAQMPSMETPADEGIPETGMRFDFSSLRVQSPEDFAALPEEQKELLRAMKRGVQFTEESAAKFVLGQRERQQRIMDETAKMQQSPEAKAAQEQSLASTQAAYESADKIVTIMDRLRGFRKDEEGADKKVPKYYGRVGPVDSAFPAMMNADRNAWFVDFQALKDQLALAARGGIKGTGPISDFEQKMLSNAAMGGLDYGRDDASFKQVFEETYNIANKKREEHMKKLSALTGATSQAAAPAASPAPLPTKKVGNQTWVRTPEGWVPQQ